MTKSPPNTSHIVRYLLGKLPEDEQTGFEERLLESEALEEAESDYLARFSRAAKSRPPSIYVA